MHALLAVATTMATSRQRALVELMAIGDDVNTVAPP